MIVYFHRDRNTYEIIYVGIGIKHKRAFDFSPKGRNNYWLNYTAKYGLPVVQIVHEYITKSECYYWEKFYIKLLKKRNDGGTLLNITDGGESRPHEIPEVKERMIKSMRKYNLLHPEKKEKHRQFMIDISKTESFKNKNIVPLINWVKDNPQENPMFKKENVDKFRGNNNPMKKDENKLKLSIINTGKIMNDETKSKLSNIKKGKVIKHLIGYKHSPEMIEKFKIINKQIANRPEVKEKLRLAALGRVNENTRKKIAKIHPTTNEVIQTYDRIMDALIEFNKPKSGNISQVCNGKRNFAFGFKWRYL